MRLQFNKIGYEMYDKEQSRRVPAVRAKPGNPGYGFRRARWRDTMGNGEDQQACDTTLRALGVAQERLDRIRQRISDFREEWDDLVQEVMLSALEHPPQHLVRFRGWLRVATIHAASRLFRRNRSRAHREERAASPERVRSASDRYEEEAFYDDLKGRISTTSR